MADMPVRLPEARIAAQWMEVEYTSFASLMSITLLRNNEPLASFDTTDDEMRVRHELSRAATDIRALLLLIADLRSEVAQQVAVINVQERDILTVNKERQTLKHQKEAIVNGLMRLVKANSDPE